MADDALIEQNVGLYVTMGVYLVILVVIASIAFARKRAASAKGGDLDAHFGGDFPAPLLVLTTFSTIYSGFTVTGVPSEAYHSGFLSLRWIAATLTIVIGMLLLYPRLRRLAVVRKYKSPSDFVTDRYRSRRLRVVSAVCAVLPLLIYLSAQMVSFASMMSGLTGGAIPKWLSMAVFVAVILALEKLGGMNSVVLTDAAQSIVMIGAFLAIPFVLGADFGFLWQAASADCDTLTYVANTSIAGAAPSTCPGPGEGCLPSGCLAAVRPEFYQYPTHREQCSMAFFLLNMLAAPLQPHMVQRAYIASSDRDLKIVMLAMLVAPFLAQVPGIMIGLTKAAYEHQWPLADQEATAFAAISDRLMAVGGLQYVLATLMTCSSLAAIMSTADSVLMGASSLISIDIYKGVINPDASTRCIVALGEINSVVMAVLAAVGGLFISVGQFGWLMTLQNGLLMQLLPAYGLGLFSGVRERGILLGILGGLAALAFMLALDVQPGGTEGSGGFVPMVNVSVAVNFGIVFFCELFLPGSEDRPSSLAEAMRERFGDRLLPGTIRGIMSSTREPSRFLLLIMGGLIVASIPMSNHPGSDEDIVFGLPSWGAKSFLCYVLVLALGVGAALCWAPRGHASGYDSDESATGSEEESLEGNEENCDHDIE